ncbi:MAG: ribosome maturation factor RimM [Burkholderiales bacterium]|nr:ribosome maturation factor RimM [Burkholderiales bacterium]
MRVAAASPPSAPEADVPADAIEVGRITDAWGIKGGFRVQPYAKDPQALFSSRRWYLRPAEPRPGQPLKPPSTPLPPLLRIQQAREQGDDIVATAHDIADRNAAEALRGARIFVPRSSFPTAGTDEFYWVDLIGLQVRNRQGDVLGTVRGLLDTGAHSVLQVQPDGEPDAPERLIPFVDAYIDRVDLQTRCIEVDWGLDF